MEMLQCGAAMIAAGGLCLLEEVCDHGATGSAGGGTASQGCFSVCAGREVCLLF